MMRRILTIWLVAIAASLGWFLQGDAGTGVVREQPLLAEGLPIDRLHEVEIEYRDGRTMRLERTGNRWKQTVPFAVGVDSYSVRQLATTAAALRGLQGLELSDSEDSRIESLGLGSPTARITWRWDAGARSLALGNRTLAGKAWIALDGDDHAWLVDSSLHARLFDIDPRLWRDGALFPDAGVETRSVGIEAGGQRLVLVREPEGWMMEEPVRTRADAASIEDWLARLSRARALGYLYDQPDDLVRFGLEPPVATIELRGRMDSDRTVMLLGDPLGVGSPDRYGMVVGSPSVLRISEDVQQALVPSAGMLVDPTGTSVIREDVARVEIRREGKGSDFVLERDFDAWKLTPEDMDSMPIPRMAVDGFLAQMTEARASEIAFTDYPAQLQEALVILYGFDGLPLDTIRIIREPNGGRWALENGDDVLRVFSVEFSPLINVAQFVNDAGPQR
ncbi:MAG: DUF4340 domain-containing protein [Planctomycetota bacterium]|nr:DUF4340 domain-containing protein [Planctomycetota bacterium]